jgi:hypothetical protein
LIRAFPGRFGTTTPPWITTGSPGAWFNAPNDAGNEQHTRQRHLKVFAIVSSDDWPDMVALAREEITGMESILRVAGAFSPPPPRPKKTPLKTALPGPSQPPRSCWCDAGRTRDP